MNNLLSILNATDRVAAIEENFQRLDTAPGFNSAIIKVDGEEVYHRIGVQRVDGALQIYASDSPVAITSTPGLLVLKVDGEEGYHRIGIQRDGDALQIYVSDEPV